MRHIAHTIAIKGKIFGIIFPEKWIYDVWTPILIIIIIKTRCYFEIEYPLYCMLPAQINLAFMAWYIFVKYITCSYSLVHSSGDMIFRRSYNHIKKQIDEIHDHCKANHLKCWTMVFKYVEIRTDFLGTLFIDNNFEYFPCPSSYTLVQEYLYFFHHFRHPEIAEHWR